jgi:hypothetical protein
MQDVRAAIALKHRSWDQSGKAHGKRALGGHRHAIAFLRIMHTIAPDAVCAALEHG